MAALFALAQKPAGGAVVISEDVGILQEFVGRDHGLEFLLRNEKIFLAVLFASPLRPRGVGNRKVEALDHLEQFVDQGRFPRSRRRRHNEDDAHSRFCTCSRAFSISDLISKPASVIFKASPAKPEVFESRVLASRFISCNRKSIFLPTSPA